MIFVDTSAFYALADRGDIYHAQARDLFKSLLKTEEELITHNYVIVESVALMHNRLGLPSAVTFLQETQHFAIVWVNEEIHLKALEYFTKQGKRRRMVSFVDCVSFIVMGREAITHAFAFDDDFLEAGFTLYGIK